MENCACGKGSEYTLPACQLTLVSPFSRWSLRACSSMAGVMSTPVACLTTRAKAQTSSPGPQATSSTVSSGPASAHCTIRLSASSLRMAGAVEKGTACRVNWSRMRELCDSADIEPDTTALSSILLLTRLSAAET